MPTVSSWKHVLIALSSSVAITCSAMPVNFQEMQAVLHTQVDLEKSDRFALIPVAPNEASRALAHAILDELGKQPAFREDMDKWLATHPTPVQEDLVKAWFRHYHEVILADSFEFLEAEDLALLWKLVGNNSLFALKRSECQGLAEQKILASADAARDKLISENKQRIATIIAQAVSKELQREQHPQAGDRRVAKVHQPMVMQSFQKMKSLWPAGDQAILQDVFSYQQTATQRTAAEECDRTWLVSHAIAESAAQGIPFLLESITKSRYAMAFSNVDTPFAKSRPTPLGFVPGKEWVHYPELPLRKSVQGKTTARISFDAEGNVTDVKIVDDSLKPASVTSGDGRIFASKDLFQTMLQRYFKAGKFPAQQAQGNPSVFDLPLDWRLAN